MNIQELIKNGLDKSNIDESLLKQFVINREELDELHELCNNQLYGILKLLNKFYKKRTIKGCNINKLEESVVRAKNAPSTCEVNGLHFSNHGYDSTLDELEIFTGVKKNCLMGDLAKRFGTTTDNIEKWFELCNGKVNSVVKCLEELSKYKRITDEDTYGHEKEECYVSVDGVNIKTSKELAEKYNSFEKEDVKEGEIYKMTDENIEVLKERAQSFISSTDEVTDEDITTNISQMLNKQHSQEWKQCLNPPHDKKLKESIANFTKNGSEMPFVDALKRDYIDSSKDIDERCANVKKEVISTTEDKSNTNIKVLNDTFDYSKQLPVNSVKMNKEIFSKLKVGDVIAYMKEDKWKYVRLSFLTIKTGTFPDNDEFGNKAFDRSAKQKFIDILNPGDIQIYYIPEDFDDCDDGDDEFQFVREQRKKEIKREFEEKKHNLIKNLQGLTYVQRKNGELIGPINDKIVNDYKCDLYGKILNVMKQYPFYQKYINDIVKYSKDNSTPVSFFVLSDIIKILELNKDLLDKDCFEYFEIILIMQQDSDYQHKINNIIEYCSNKQIDIKELSVNDIGDIMKFELDNFQIKGNWIEKIEGMNHNGIMNIVNNFDYSESETVDYLMLNFKEMLSNLIKKIKYTDCDDKTFIMNNLHSLLVSISHLSKSISENIKWETIKR